MCDDALLAMQRPQEVSRHKNQYRQKVNTIMQTRQENALHQIGL